MNDRTEETFEIPWWLSGDEQCPFCYHRYAVELEVRCSGCDRPLCENCVVTVRETQELFCCECLDEAEEA